jgi:nicotinamide riboside kinase
MYLLCYYDIEWEFDTIRENGNDEQRAYLFAKYLEEIKKTGCKYQIIKGFNKERSKLAIQTIERTILQC